MKKLAKLVLIDGNALVHRAYHALPPLSNKGEPTNAVYGFTSILLKVLRELRPEYVAATFDLAAPTFRHEEFADYKAHRPKTADDLIVQFPKVKEIVSALGIPIYEKEGYEADDMIGTIATHAYETTPNVKCIIITGDLDTLQLVNERTEVLTPKKGISDTVIYDEQAVRARFGLAPSQMNDFKGLKGDPSDNIPGVPGVGEKTATALLTQYGSLEEVYAHLDDMPEKMRAKLAPHKEQAFFSKSLSTIRCNVPLEFDLQKVKFGEYDQHEIEALLRKYGFTSLISRLALHRQPQEESVVAESEPVKEVQGDIEKIGKEKIIACAWDGTHIQVTARDGTPYQSSLAEIKNILENERIKKICYDSKQLIKACRNEGITPRGIEFDGMLAAYLLSSGEREYPLEHIERKYSVAGKPPLSFFALRDQLDNALRTEGLVKVMYEIEMPLVPVLAEMERVGIKIDVKALETLSTHLEQEKKKSTKSIFALAGEEFNLDSPAQLSKILFEKLAIALPARAKRVKSGLYSTKADELEKIRDAHPIVAEIMRYREVAKLKSTYADSLQVAVHPDTGRIHTIFNQTGTATGRLSSSEPNMQNIPQKGEFADAVRSAFVADEGFSFVALDFSQIELRIIASLSGDEKMIRIFESGGDIHRATAAEINHVPLEQVTKEMRNAAKALNFGILYGMGQRAFAQTAGIDQKTAKQFIEEYFKNFTGVASFIEKTKEHVKKYGCVQTLTGRKRWLPEIHSQNPMVRNGAERMAQNMPTQGLQADIIKIAMIRVARDVLSLRRDEGVRLLLQIHDELIFEVKDDIIKEVVPTIRHIMESVFPLRVPIRVDVYTGKRWGALHSFI
ncbi:MAG: DNA polymerase I [Candidatus Azambacteria bacterium]|nr:DNA polymerase I [Candidatus Azambacteria bacterium]